ncbi:MAG: hypothetical protein MI748_05905 [Opitutales bacterium]|nr:hypothetical protein [Opitutales bacterium]
MQSRFYLQSPHHSGNQNQATVKVITMFFVLIIGTTMQSFGKNDYFEVSGIYPHLAMFNDEGECGIGAVVPWANRLWVITYGPHLPRGSSDKLYEITPDLQQIIRDESIGGTPANRMVHKESQQLFIGPHAIDHQGTVRTIPYVAMIGRHTGNARHLTDPENKLYYATMEEGFYEVDVQSLEVTELFSDLHSDYDSIHAELLGAHGKGLYSGQGRLIYSNNGELGSSEWIYNPYMTSGSLSEWNGKEWKLISRAQYTEVTGPGGIYGNANPESDPIWAIGWDAKSLRLALLDDGIWSHFRLPKASHSYDGAHGWNTEWPRIREIGENSLLMIMHGMFWHFPKTFSAKNTKGILPRSTYLKVIGDFTKWGDKIVFGCDDTANREFLNTRVAKGEIASPQSQSNLWFVDVEKIDHFGPAIGRGALWINEDLPENNVSEAMLVAGFDHKGIHLSVGGFEKTTLEIQGDKDGSGNWETINRITLPANGYKWYDLSEMKDVVWIRIRTEDAVNNATAYFELSNQDTRTYERSSKFDGLLRVGANQCVGGLIHAMDDSARKLQFAAVRVFNDETVNSGYYHLTAEMKLEEVHAPGAWEWIQEHVAIPERAWNVLHVGAHSVVFSTPDKKRFHLPKTNPKFDQAGVLGWGRLVREVATERDLFHCHGTYYELPANNAGGFAMIRPISTHDLDVHDYCSYRGLFVMSGVDSKYEGSNPHIIRSENGEVALWVGVLDDLWQLGKPRGYGGPWYRSKVGAGENSDAFLIRGYDKKTLKINARSPTIITAQIDISGRGDWRDFKTFDLTEDCLEVDYEFPAGFQAYWIRFHSTDTSVITTTLTYE